MVVPGKEVVYRQVINKKSERGNTNIISREGELAITRDSRFQITLFCSFDAKGVATAFFRSLQEVPLNATDFNTFQYSLRLYRSASYKDFFKLEIPKKIMLKNIAQFRFRRINFFTKVINSL